VSLTPAINHPGQDVIAGANDTGEQLIANVNDTGRKHNVAQIFVKIRNVPARTLKGPEETA
jgi:hypothetical protein